MAGINHVVEVRGVVDCDHLNLASKIKGNPKIAAWLEGNRVLIVWSCYGLLSVTCNMTQRSVFQPLP